MKNILRARSCSASLVISSLVFLAASARGAFTWNETAAMVYDGTVDANPYNFGAGIDADNDISIRSGGSLTVQNGTFNMHPGTPWGDKIGHGSTGTLTVKNGGIVNWTVDNDNEDRLMFGNGANGVCILNMNGGVFNVVGPGGYDHVERNVRFGSDGGAATVNLVAGVFDVQVVIPVAFGGKWVAGGTTFTNGTSPSTMTVTDGWFKVSGDGPFGVGNGTINFVSGGTGGFLIKGWTQAQFEALVSAGKIKKDGAVAVASNFVYALNGAQGEYKLDNAVLFAPTIVTPPAPVITVVGANASFETVVSGNPVPTLLWEVSLNGGVDWNPAGSTSSTLSLPGVTYAMNGRQYRVTASNGQGSPAVSAPVALTVSYPLPVISKQPKADTAIAGTTASFSITATGIAALNYQWEHSTNSGASWTPVGANSAVLNFAAVTTSDSGLYRVRVTDPAGEVDHASTTLDSSVAPLTVIDVPIPSEVISLNFPGAAGAGNPYGGSAEAGLLGDVEAAGVADSKHWNNAPANVATQATEMALVDAAGNSTTATATWASANTWAVTTATGAVAAKTADERLMHGYIERRANQGGPVVTISAVPYSTYDVYVYVTAGVENVVGSVYVNGNSGAAQFYKSLGGSAYQGLHLTAALTSGDAAASTFAGTVIRFSGLSGSVLTINQLDFNGNAGGLAGIQIVKTVATPAYDLWASANVGNQGAEQDFDGDGVKNGIEYFMNAPAGVTLNPQIAGGSITWPNGGNIPSDSYGVHFKVQTSADLSHWDNVPASDPNLSNSIGGVGYTLPVGAGKLFVRLIVMPN